MNKIYKKLKKVDFEKAKEMIAKQRETSIDVISTALKIVNEETGENRLWFGEFGDSPLAKDGQTIDNVFVKNGVPWVDMSGEYENDSMPAADMDIEYLIEFAEYVRDNIEEIIEALKD